jgi:hypothetical protein
MYLVMGILIRPDWYPGLIGHLMIWILYGISFYLLFRSQKTPDMVFEENDQDTWGERKWLYLAGIFPLAATASELLLGWVGGALAIIFWFGGIIFGLVMFIKAVRLTFPKEGDLQHA